MNHCSRMSSTAVDIFETPNFTGTVVLRDTSTSVDGLEYIQFVSFMSFLWPKSFKLLFEFPLLCLCCFADYFFPVRRQTKRKKGKKCIYIAPLL